MFDEVAPPSYSSSTKAADKGENKGEGSGAALEHGNSRSCELADAEGAEELYEGIDLILVAGDLDREAFGADVDDACPEDIRMSG